MLVTITHDDGSEKSRVVQLTPEEAQASEALKAAIAAGLDKNKNVSVTALSQLVWDLLGKNGK